MERVYHEIEPVFDEKSKILILGSFPSVKSREGHFFYHHPRNRFWKVMAAELECDIPSTVEEKKKMLLTHHIAIWDVIAICEISGSSDSSIRNVIPNDLNMILKRASIREIFTNGGTAYQLYQKYCRENTQKEAIRLPSTSPANAAYSMERLTKEWSVIRNLF